MVELTDGTGPLFAEVNNGNEYIVILTPDGSNRMIYPSLGKKPNLGDLVNFHVNFQLAKQGQLLLDTSEELNRCGEEILNANSRLFDSNNDLSLAARSVPIIIPNLDENGHPSVCIHGIPGMVSAPAQATVEAHSLQVATQKQLNHDRAMTTLAVGIGIGAIGLGVCLWAGNKFLHYSHRGYNVPAPQPMVDSSLKVFTNLDELRNFQQQAAGKLAPGEDLTVDETHGVLHYHGPDTGYVVGHTQNRPDPLPAISHPQIIRSAKQRDSLIANHRSRHPDDRIYDSEGPQKDLLVAYPPEESGRVPETLGKFPTQT